jgi:guanine deaminase
MPPTQVFFSFLPGCFGCVIVDGTTGDIVGEGHNQVIADNDPTAHGEMVALRDAGKRLGKPWLKGCVVYTSAEPCPMCFSVSASGGV